MQFDIFFSICQMEVDGHLPTERLLLTNFFDQLVLADALGFGTAWVAETHLSCQVQKLNPNPVIPHFNGEIGINTDILQLAHLGFAKTKQINIGSAIRNIICNGGPVAHAEAVKTFISLHQLYHDSNRKLELGFAAGRFPFTNNAYGFYPKTDFEKQHWGAVKNKYFMQASEIFLRLLNGEHLDSTQISRQVVADTALDCHWQFDKLGVLPNEVNMGYLALTIGAHDPDAQLHANRFRPVGVFNLSITPAAVIEETHRRMEQCYHPAGGGWQRRLLPRTVMIFVNDDAGKSAAEQSAHAKAQAERAWRNFWIAMDGTVNANKIKDAIDNSIAGNVQEVTEKMKATYHTDDRLMLWFDFNNYDNADVKKSMQVFMEKVVPHL